MPSKKPVKTMCGIVAYIGQRDVVPVIMKGLHRLEYRGYDSAGLAIHGPSGLEVYKRRGKVSELEDWVQDKNISSHIGIGHTRWATHGEPNDVNAHPHLSPDGKIAVVHNGIIENYESLRRHLLAKGYTFRSETDTEVLAVLIADFQKEHGFDLERAVRMALHRVVGAYLVAVLSTDEPNTLVVARKGSPGVIGIGDDEFLVASDATPIIEYTKRVVYLNEDELAVISDKGLTLKNLKNEQRSPEIEQLDLELTAIEKEGYPHFMLKEIYEQPKTVRDCLRGRLRANEATIKLGGIREYAEHLNRAERVVFLACGTSWHAGIVASYLFEDLCHIPATSDYASEFRYRNPVIREGDVVFVISQSGETADTLKAIDMVKERGGIVLGICNVVGSSISRETHEGVYTHSGPEIGVASTKAFTGQLAVLTLIALKLASERSTLSAMRLNQLLRDLDQVPQKIEEVLTQNDHIKAIAEQYAKVKNMLFMGRGAQFPIALEGALKLKEISYIHAEGYPSGEMKHGPIALVEEATPSLFLCFKDGNYEKVFSNIQEVKARKGKVIVIGEQGDAELEEISDAFIGVPAIDPVLMPMVSVVALQLFAYHMGVLNGRNVDQPRNLAKSVTVE